MALSLGEFRVNPDYLARMSDSMAHRGPDGEGLWVAPDGTAGLCHRRLSIIDLSDAAAQPMSNEDGTLWVVFNGEIYNHAEIRRELAGLGSHRWRTDHSDTEVILHSFEQWGIDAISRFRGMFAFALWDANKRELWLVRDRIGIKPLYYSVHHGRLTFASEIKALFEDEEQERGIDEEAFFHYLSFLTTPAPQTLYRGIRKLRPGTWMRITQTGDFEERRYWDVWDNVTPTPGASENAIAEAILDTLRASVRLRKVSDVPVGVFLSGGLDSSANAVLFSEGESRPVKTFSIGYDGNNPSYPNELEYARLIARQIGAEHHELLLRPNDMVDFLPKMIHLQDEPIADPVCVPLYYVSKMARDNGVVVCQVGEGADELFCGYPAWRVQLWLQNLGDATWGCVKRAGLGALRLTGRMDTREYEFLRRGARGEPVFWGGAEAFTQSQKQRLLHPRLKQRLRSLTSWDVLKSFRRNFEQKAWDRSHLNWMTYLDLNFRLPELLLMRVDKMSMGASVEARVPYLDHRFVELAMGLPAALKVKNGKLKYLLKQAVGGLVPDSIVHRKKQGFALPVREWFRASLGKIAEAELMHFCARTELLNAQEVRRVLEHGDPRQGWYLLNVALAWKHYVAREPLCYN